MNQKNYEFLKDQVKFTGFGEGLEKALKEKIELQQPEFQLKHQHEFGKDELTAQLHFKKSGQTDMYFFNRYDLSLKKGNSDDTIQQAFYIGKDNNFTLKEGYNMLSGRAVNKELVNKEGQSYNAWVQVDFKDTDANGNYKLKHFHENYGFDLEKALSKYPIKELNNEEDKNKLMDSLRKGNRQFVTFTYKDNKEQRRFIEANPQFKSINVYNGNMKRIRQYEKAYDGESTKQEIKKENKQQKQELDDAEVQPAKKKARKKKQSVS